MKDRYNWPYLPSKFRWKYGMANWYWSNAVRGGMVTLKFSHIHICKEVSMWLRRKQ